MAYYGIMDGCCIMAGIFQTRSGWGGSREGRLNQAIYPTKPRSRSEKSAADTKLEKTSLSAGGFLWVSYGYTAWFRLRDWQA